MKNLLNVHAGRFSGT